MHRNILPLRSEDCFVYAGRPSLHAVKAPRYTDESSLFSEREKNFKEEFRCINEKRKGAVFFFRMGREE